MSSRYVTVLGRELHYAEWGCSHRETIVMWHGLARTGREFDDLAAPLSERYPVVCPDTIDIPVLCLRGANSDLLQAGTAQAMQVRGPRAHVVEITGCGHAPALNVPEQIALVERFLAG